ncbi:class I SAM-dependent methyltransferase [Clostridium botulinum]|uniref:SAM-dependent methyltransferase n=1 Tax=Clostridium botulinum TaxID=1491 RepID=A0A9Q1ZBZ3_CLOBO|nr:class I SAM-dependent methyltransferase [Clostridium botulinum]AEB75789.1 putative methyltransferase [Clostridium botulinum BKT015925]KEH98581.1 SAM-dependent methyltransferase [Clostridium botulinum D str. 16868]KEI05755.1 SAM-dependent methyltransferase [Clostridium botulinum C/D str. Sp77]KLU75626.1 SAM-dependent methyltransferase [Clostridium botulinum V891]KOA75301.1 SAM-dependent methyltransferase [Clostridium botulinum]
MMDVFTINKKMWEDNINKYDLFWPDENIVRFLNKNYEKGNRENINVLEIGCGAGRNIIGIAMEGFKTYGIDYNENCIKLSNEKVQSFNLKNVNIEKNQGSYIPYEDEKFDCIIVGTILSLLANKEERNLMFKEIYRCLKKGGVVYSYWRDKSDYFYEKGTKIEEDTFILKNNEFGLSDMVYYFVDKEKILQDHKEFEFEVYNLEKKDFYIDNMSVKNSHWHVWAKKK